MIYVVDPKNYTNYIMNNNNKNIGIFLEINQLSKILNYKYLMTKKLTIIFFKSNKFCKKPKEKVCHLHLCDFSKLIFSFIF
jgi:hypothetical protein